MKKSMFHGIVFSGLLFASNLGCAEKTTTERKQALAEIEVSRAEQPREESRFKRDKDSEEYSFYTQSWSGKLPKSIGEMSSDEAADFVLKVVSDSFTSYGRQSLKRIEASPLLEQSPEKPDRRVGLFIDILQNYKGAKLGRVRSATKQQGGIHAMLNDMPNVPGQKAQGPSVSIDVIIWKVVREHGKAKPVLPEKQVRDILLKDFVAKYQYAKNRGTDFTYLDLVYLPRADNPKRWIPRWLAEMKTPHPGSYTPGNPMKPTIHSYVVDAWSGKILESERELVPVASVGTEPAPSPPAKDSTKKTSNKPDAGDGK